MFVERFVKIGISILFNSSNVRGNEKYIIKVSDYMTLNYFPLIHIPSGEDP